MLNRMLMSLKSRVLVLPVMLNLTMMLLTLRVCVVGLGTKMLEKEGMVITHTVENADGRRVGKVG